MNRILNSAFYDQPPETVAKSLLGKLLVREYKGQKLSGVITETEAYVAFTDSASHAFRGKTERNAIMFGRAGLAYVYFVYGLHYMLNVVTEAEGMPSAVLIRGVEPVQGRAEMVKLRNSDGKNLTNGPARICQAFSINKALNGWDLTKGSELWIERPAVTRSIHVLAGPRIGIGYAKEADRNQLLRFWIKLADRK